MHEVSAEKQSLCYFSLCANRDHLAARVYQHIRIERQEIEVQSKASKLCSIEIAATGLNRDISRRQLNGRHHLWIDIHRHARQRCRETRLTGSRRVGCQSIEPVHQITRDQVRLNLRVVHTITTANRHSRIAAGMPTEAHARLKVPLRVSQGLTVVAQTEIQSQIGTDFPVVLHESRQEPLWKVVAVDSKVNRLLITLDVGKC